MLGYNPEQKTSTKALQWIKFQSFKHNLKISHAKTVANSKLETIWLMAFVKRLKLYTNFMVAFGTGVKSVTNLTLRIQSKES